MTENQTPNRIKILSVSLSPELFEELKHIAGRRGVSKFIREAITTLIKENKTKEDKHE